MSIKSLKDLAPTYLRQLLIRNSQQFYRPLRNTDRDLKLPLRKTDNGQTDILLEEQNRVKVAQLVLNKHYH